jgi:hypothetical protein
MFKHRQTQQLLNRVLPKDISNIIMEFCTPIRKINSYSYYIRSDITYLNYKSDLRGLDRSYPSYLTYLIINNDFYDSSYKSCAFKQYLQSRRIQYDDKIWGISTKLIDKLFPPAIISAIIVLSLEIIYFMILIIYKMTR